LDSRPIEVNKDDFKVFFGQIAIFPVVVEFFGAPWVVDLGKE